MLLSHSALISVVTKIICKCSRQCPSVLRNVYTDWDCTRIRYQLIAFAEKTNSAEGHIGTSISHQPHSPAFNLLGGTELTLRGRGQVSLIYQPVKCQYILKTMVFWSTTRPGCSPIQCRNYGVKKREAKIPLPLLFWAPVFSLRDIRPKGRPKWPYWLTVSWVSVSSVPDDQVLGDAWPGWWKR